MRCATTEAAPADGARVARLPTRRGKPARRHAPHVGQHFSQQCRHWHRHHRRRYCRCMASTKFVNRHRPHRHGRRTRSRRFCRLLHSVRRRRSGPPPSPPSTKYARRKPLSIFVALAVTLGTPGTTAHDRSARRRRAISDGTYPPNEAGTASRRSNIGSHLLNSHTTVHIRIVSNKSPFQIRQQTASQSIEAANSVAIQPIRFRVARLAIFPRTPKKFISNAPKVPKIN